LYHERFGVGQVAVPKRCFELRFGTFGLSDSGETGVFQLLCMMNLDYCVWQRWPCCGVFTPTDRSFQNFRRLLKIFSASTVFADGCSVLQVHVGTRGTRGTRKTVVTDERLGERRVVRAARRSLLCG
jgi:hypothetical protein